MGSRGWALCRMGGADYSHLPWVTGLGKGLPVPHLHPSLQHARSGKIQWSGRRVEKKSVIEGQGTFRSCSDMCSLNCQGVARTCFILWCCRRGGYGWQRLQHLFSCA